ncbi:Peptidase M14 and/or Propep M14 domain containing protein, partial [Asbolus verrucosus]
YLEDTCSDFSFWTNVKAINHNVDVMVSPDSTYNVQDIIKNNDLQSKIIIPNVQKLIDNILDGLIITDLKKLVMTISSAVVTYILNQLLTNTDPKVRQVAESHDWYIFPVINPDGFVYTHTTDRAWRKTRVSHGDTCVGADPNRNWGYHYNEGGANNDPCSNNYCGPEAFSEPSMKSLSEFISTIGESLEGYISFHSYSQIFTFVIWYTVGLKAIDALAQRYGTEYRIDIASGGSPDWIKGSFGTRITYTYELRDTGENGFLLPAEQILPTTEETFDSFITIFQEWSVV